MTKTFLVNATSDPRINKLCLHFSEKVERKWLLCGASQLRILKLKWLQTSLTERPRTTYAHNLKAFLVVILHIMANFFRPTPIKSYWACKSEFSVLFFHISKLKSFILLKKVSNCEKMVGNYGKWLVNSYVAGFKGSYEHNNSILVSEWFGALCPVRLSEAVVQI